MDIKIESRKAEPEKGIEAILCRFRQPNGAIIVPIIHAKKLCKITSESVAAWELLPDKVSALFLEKDV